MERRYRSNRSVSAGLPLAERRGKRDLGAVIVLLVDNGIGSVTDRSWREASREGRESDMEEI